MDLTTHYLGFKLKNPFILGASPLVDNIDTLCRIEDAGAAAVVMHSLFVEQIEYQQTGYIHHIESHEDSYAEATDYFPDMDAFAFGPDQYLSHIQKIKSRLEIPVIASLNGSERGDWFQYARMMEEVGADGLELNLYYLATDPGVSGPELEDRLLHVVSGIRSRTQLPLAVKLSPFYTSLSHFAARLDEAGVDALVLFNRFYQPDIDIENLEINPFLQLSDSSELLLRLRWISILYGRVKADLGLTGGVHSLEDALKGIMAGAEAVQMVSRILKEGPTVFSSLLEALKIWMEAHQYGSLDEMRGSMSHLKSGDSEGIERTNYLKILRSWQAEV